MNSRELPILIICAMQAEIEPLTRRITERQWLCRRPRFFTGRLYGCHAGVLICGVGGKTASASLRIALSLCRPQRAIIAGWAGALHDSLNSLSVVLATGVKRSENPGDPPLLPHTGIQERMAECCPEIHRGLLVTSNVMVDRAVLREELARSTGAVMVDMETHHLLKILQEQNIPSGILRVITDPADERIGIDFLRIPRGRRRRFLHWLQHPVQCLRMIRLKRTLHHATGSLDQCLSRVLSRMQTSPQPEDRR